MQLFQLISRTILSFLPFLLIGGAVFFCVKLRFFPFLHPLRTLRVLFSRSTADGEADGTSPFRAASVALAGTVGVGNIAGVALSLLYGGAGAILWMWVFGAAAMILKYAEITLSLSLREKDGKGNPRGGTPYALRALGHPHAAAAFAALCLLYSFTVGGMVQANAIAECLYDTTALPPVLSGVLLLLITLPAVIGGGKRISAMTARLVPLMCLFYVGAAVFVIGANVGRLPLALRAILQDAFSPAAVGGGALSFLFGSALRTGASRALMSNEGGCGTATLAHAESCVRDPARQGLFGMLEVAIDTLVICTLTAFAVLTALPTLPEGVGGMALVRLAFADALGDAAPWVLSVSLFFFAYATILSAAFYSEKCLSFFGLGAPVCRKTAIFFCFLLPVGALAGTGVIWGACDLLLAAMAFCNLPLLLSQANRIRHLSEEGGLIQ